MRGPGAYARIGIEDTHRTALETDTMAHNPLNHPLRPVYRAISGIVGLYFIVFGVVGVIVTGGEGMFARDTERVLGQGANLFWSIVSIIIGLAVLVATVIGRNLDAAVDTYLGWALLVIGTFSMTVIRTGVNFMQFTISTVIVTYIAGLLLILAGLYTKVGPEEHANEPQPVRQRQAA
ncbi:MAG TPA: DUF4383 domain-containing protein [Actinoplanes sp.]|jgi:hypothetical protein